MKLAWRKVTTGASMPAGSDFFIGQRGLDRAGGAMVSAVGCFWMPRMTAGLPSKPASPRLMARGQKSRRNLAQQDHGWPIAGREREVLQVLQARGAGPGCG